MIEPLAQGAAPELDRLREACRTAIRTAIRTVARPGRRVVIIGPGPASGACPPGARGSFAGFGLPLEVGLGDEPDGPLTLPATLTVGAWLLNDALANNAVALAYAVADP